MFKEYKTSFSIILMLCILTCSTNQTLSYDFNNFYNVFLKIGTKKVETKTSIFKKPVFWILNATNFGLLVTILLLFKKIKNQVNIPEPENTDNLNFNSHEHIFNHIVHLQRKPPSNQNIEFKPTNTEIKHNNPEQPESVDNNSNNEKRVKNKIKIIRKANLNSNRVKSDKELEKFLSACSSGNVEEVRKFLDNGFDVNIFYHKYYLDVPIFRAALGWNIEIIKLLIERGANINFIANGLTLLSIMLHKGNFNRDIFELLIENGTNINQADNDGETPLHLAFRDKLTFEIEFLINNGANIEIRNNYGQTPLHYSCYSRYHTAFELLIKKGANVNIPDNKGRTPLHIISKNGCERNAELLINHGADINSVNNDGQTPLHIAVYRHNLDVARFLVENGADIYKLDNNNQSPLSLAKRKCNREFVKSVFNIENYTLDQEDAEFDEYEKTKHENCSICMENFTDKVNGVACKTECNHYFHKDCINAWLIEHETCPNCRTRQTKNFY